MEKIKATWPEWDVIRIIGQGSFGAVYEIRREVFGKVESAALKVITIPQHDEEIEELRSEGYDDASLTTHFRGYLEDIAREYSLMLDIKGHTNVVYCDDVRYIQHDDGIGWDVFIKMELLTPLMKEISKSYDEQQVIKLGMDMCNALILCKNENIVHRDIKPQNIFVSKSGDYKLGDFGVAKISDKTVSGTKIGTFKYMAPEVYKSQPYGNSSDLYSLGLVLYWAMNEKRTPFLPLPPQIPSPSMEEEARQRRFSGEPVPAPVNGSEALKQIVCKACAYDPRDRFQDPAQMWEALDQLRSGSRHVWQSNLPEEDKTVGAFGGSRYAAPAPGEREEETVGAFGGNRNVATAEPQTEEHTVGMFNNSRPVAAVGEDRTVGVFGNSRPGAVSAAAPEDQEQTVGVFGKREAPVAAPVPPAPQPVQEPAPKPVQPEQKVIPPIQPQPIPETPVPGPVEDIPEPPKKKKTGLFVFLGIIAALVIGAAAIWFSGSGWGCDDGKYYYLDHGRILKGMQVIDGETYYFDEEGVRQTGFQDIDGKRYFFQDDGTMATGSLTIDGEHYYFQDDGTMGTGWATMFGTLKFYYLEDGRRAEGFQTIDGATYYFDDAGYITGKALINGVGYYFDEETGIMATGEAVTARNLDGSPQEISYFDESGKFQYRETAKGIFFAEWTDDSSFSESYRQMDQIEENVTYLKMTTEFVELNGGSPDGEWQGYVRNLEGEWILVGSCQMKDGIATLEAELEEPIAFDAFAMKDNHSTWYSGSYTQNLDQIVFETTDFGRAEEIN